MEKISLDTHCGMVRSDNQDTARAGKLQSGEIWAVVCDGMGGAVGGDIASSLATDCFEQMIETNYRSDFSANSIRNFLVTAVTKANAMILEKIENEPELSGMGTTVVGVLIKDNTAYIVHVGDSRAYVVDQSGLTQITKDHSMVQVLVEQGQLSPDEARVHPKRNVITRVVGIDAQVQVDYDEVYFEEGQMLLVCTDGLTNMMTDEEIARVIKTTPFFDVTSALVKLSNMAGGTDNITVVLVG